MWQECRSACQRRRIIDGVNRFICGNHAFQAGWISVWSMFRVSMLWELIGRQVGILTITNIHSSPVQWTRKDVKDWLWFLALTSWNTGTNGRLRQPREQHWLALVAKGFRSLQVLGWVGDLHISLRIPNRECKLWFRQPSLFIHKKSPLEVHWSPLPVLWFKNLL